MCYWDIRSITQSGELIIQDRNKIINQISKENIEHKLNEDSIEDRTDIDKITGKQIDTDDGITGKFLSFFGDTREVKTLKFICGVDNINMFTSV